MSEPTEQRYAVNGVELCVFEWPGTGPPLLFIHASSMHARCWDQVIRRLPGHHAYAVDMRGHGRSTVHEPPYPWSQMAEDVAVLAQQLDLHGIVGVGHSMGGHLVTRAAARDPQRFGALVLVDAVINDRRPERADDGPRPQIASSSRKSMFASPDEMVERYRDRWPFRSWDPAALRDYCVYGLLPSPDGDGYVLACPPDKEMAIYAGASESEVLDELGSITVPVCVIRAREPEEGQPRFGGSTSAPDLADRFTASPAVQYVQLHDNSHHIPMESPDVVARHVLEMVAIVEQRR